MPKLSDIRNARLLHDLEIVVIVEGDDDVLVLQHRWLPKWKRPKHKLIRFEQPTKAGGCLAVVDQVEAVPAIFRNVVTFGIVDRDVLLHPKHKNVELFLEPDDATFRGGLKLDERVYCLSCWEIENYLLLDVGPLERILKNEAAKGPARPEEAVLRELLDVADTLVPLVAARTWQASQEHPEPHNWRLAWGEGRAEVEEKLIEKIPSLHEWVARVERFNPPDGADDAKRWASLVRIVKGKALLSRLLHRHGLGPSDTKLKSIRAHLADASAVPDEISAALEGFARQADQHRADARRAPEGGA